MSDYEPVHETEDCTHCGGALVGYAFDGTLLFEQDYCHHEDICRDCEAELHGGCNECDRQRYEDRMIERAEAERKGEL